MSTFATVKLLKSFRIVRNAPICTHNKPFDDFGYTSVMVQRQRRFSVESMIFCLI